MQKHTAIGDALAANGVTRLNVKFQLAIAEFQNNGGEYGVALAMLNAAYGKGSKAGPIVPKGSAALADASRQNDDVGHLRDADKAGLHLPASSPVRSYGRAFSADEAVRKLPYAAKRMPGHAKRGLAEIASIQDTIARSLFDTTRLPDGRKLREVHWAEVPALASRYSFLSRVMLVVHRKAVPADPAATLDQIVSEDELKEIIGSVEKLNDIH